jgi:hypothetical protein
MKIKFYWSTAEGNEWLNEVAEVEPTASALTDAAEEYYNRTKEEADRLVSGWQRNGEDAVLFPNAESFGYSSPIVNAALYRAFDSLHT